MCIYNQIISRCSDVETVVIVHLHPFLSFEDALQVRMRDPINIRSSDVSCIVIINIDEVLKESCVDERMRIIAEERSLLWLVHRLVKPLQQIFFLEPKLISNCKASDIYEAELMTEICQVQHFLLLCICGLPCISLHYRHIDCLRNGDLCIDVQTHS